MSNEPSSSSEGSSPLPKATMPVELAPPSKPSADAPPSEQPVEESPAGEQPEQTDQMPAAAAPSAAPEDKPKGFGGWLRSLSVVEKCCCGAIVLAVIVFAALVFLPQLYDFPEEPEYLSSEDFPLKGAQLEVSSAESYWREPVKEGPDADSVQSGSLLLPVLDTKLSGQGDVRVLFRDADGAVAGDLLTLKLSVDQDYSAVATAGFKQRSDFAAYQAGEIEPWVVEFHEVPQESEGIGEKTLLFKMNISPILK